MMTIFLRTKETMARCVCEFDSFCGMFPKVPKEDIIVILNYVANASRRKIRMLVK